MTGCGTTGSDDLPLSVCPPWPIAGSNVADELERIPFRGWPELVLLREEARQLHLLTDPIIVDSFYSRVIDEINNLQPENGFEHFWNWMNDLHDLKEQIELCR